MTAVASVAMPVVTVPQSSFLRNLSVALGSAMWAEKSLTVEVGVMNAGGLTRAEIVQNVKQRHPHVEELDIRMAMLRLKRIAGEWRD